MRYVGNEAAAQFFQLAPCLIGVQKAAAQFVKRGGKRAYFVILLDVAAFSIIMLGHFLRYFLHAV